MEERNRLGAMLCLSRLGSIDARASAGDIDARASPGVIDARAKKLGLAVVATLAMDAMRLMRLGLSVLSMRDRNSSKLMPPLLSASARAMSLCA